MSEQNTIPAEMLDAAADAEGVPPSEVTRSAPLGRALVSTIPPPLRVGAEGQVTIND